jgi:uncharacterized membrane protein
MIGGLLLLVPMIATFLVLRWLFYAIDGLLQPAIQRVFDRQMPAGFGILVLVVLLYVVGLVGKNFLGRRLFDLLRVTALRIPLIGTVYSYAKQLIDALSGVETSSFRQVVMIEYPRKDAWTIGFLTGSTTDNEGNHLSIIYVPTAPTPQSGWVAILPEKDVLYTDLSVATAMRLVLSGGIVAPSMIRTSRVS